MVYLDIRRIDFLSESHRFFVNNFYVARSSVGAKENHRRSGSHSMSGADRQSKSNGNSHRFLKTIDQLEGMFTQENYYPFFLPCSKLGVDNIQREVVNLCKISVSTLEISYSIHFLAVQYQSLIFILQIVARVWKCQIFEEKIKKKK